MAEKARTLLRQLDRLKSSFGDDSAERKIALLDKLDRRRLESARDVLTLHEALCFLRGYPDNRELLAKVERMLACFSERSDLKRFARALADSGIAGTPIDFQFYWTTAEWLARHWPDRITIDWKSFERKGRLETFLHTLLPYSESLALDELGHSTREWIDHLKSPDETDAAFLIQRFAALRADLFLRETLFEDIDAPIHLAAGPGTPSRTHARYAKLPTCFQASPLRQRRPDLVEEAKRPPLRVRAVSPREGSKLIDLAREAMVTRSRDLDVFMHADKNDVRLIDCGDGLVFVCYGAVPERRLMLESVYGFLTLRNGVPAGYVLCSSLFNSSAVAYNIFETYRGGESAYVYGRVLAMIRHLFGTDAFAVDPFQLGHDNMEGLKSGAWWFYYKLKFRPYDPDVRRIMRAELKQMKADPTHRSSIATLQNLTAEHVFLYMGRRRDDVMGMIDLGEIGGKIVRTLAHRFGSDRERAIRECSREAARMLGVRSMRRFTRGERIAWANWAPLVATLPGVDRWSRENKRALVGVIRAKGGRRESEFVRRFDQHRRLRRAILKLADPA